MRNNLKKKLFLEEHCYVGVLKYYLVISLKKKYSENIAGNKLKLQIEEF